MALDDGINEHEQTEIDEYGDVWTSVTRKVCNLKAIINIYKMTFDYGRMNNTNFEYYKQGKLPI